MASFVPFGLTLVVVLSLASALINQQQQFQVKSVYSDVISPSNSIDPSSKHLLKLSWANTTITKAQVALNQSESMDNDGNIWKARRLVLNSMRKLDDEILLLQADPSEDPALLTAAVEKLNEERIHLVTIMQRNQVKFATKEWSNVSK